MTERIMLINVVDQTESRTAILENDKLDELYIEGDTYPSFIGNIYKARVLNIEPSFQAAFVDLGLAQPGFLHLSELDFSVIPGNAGSKIPAHKRTIQSLLRKGMEMIVQVTKDPIDKKGPSVSTYVSLAGRYLVLMPNENKNGVSKKIEDDRERHRLKEVLDELGIPKNIGVIARTAAIGVKKTDLAKDCRYLQTQWKDIRKEFERAKAPAVLHKERDLALRTIRDLFTPDIKNIFVDSEPVFQRCMSFMKVIAPRSTRVLKLYRETTPLFYKYNVEEQIEQVFGRRVSLASGATLIIDQTEALTAIDVNSGRYRERKDPELTAFETNREAVPEIVRQLKLRDIGGVIVIDFIDMRDKKHKNEIEKLLSNELKKDRTRSIMTKISVFGLVEITRQKFRPSISRSLTVECPHCRGTGYVRSPEPMALAVFRQIALHSKNEKVDKIFIKTNPEVANLLLNKKRCDLARIETETRQMIFIEGDAGLGSDASEFILYDKNNQILD